MSHKKAYKAQMFFQNTWCFLAALCLGFLLTGETAAQDTLALKQSRGRQIYLQGTSRSGKEILAYIGDASLELPGSTMPCAGCHGLDGRGKSEGGVNPSNVTWEFLTKPYGLKHADGRQHPPYTERGLELAIARGTDPAGNKLLQAMPRYVMSREDLTDLISYLQLLGKEPEPGISENKIVIGTLVPSTGNLAELGRGITAITNALFEEINSQGGIYGRRLELQVIEGADSPSAARAKLEPLLKDQHLFAMTGAMIAGMEKELVPLFSQNETPLVGPQTLYPQIGFPLNRQVFYVSSGLDQRARSLLSFVGTKPELKNSRIAVIYVANDLHGSVIAAVKDDKKDPQVIEYVAGSFDAAGTVKQVRAAGGENVFFLGHVDDVLSFMREAEKQNWFPAVLIPGANVGSVLFAAPAGFDGKVFMAFPLSNSDQTEDGIKEFRALVGKHKLPQLNVGGQLFGYAAAKILTEAIKRVGKDLSREKLIQALEGFHEYSTGLTPPITYGPNRRIGAKGAYIITIDLKEKKLVPVSGWIESN